MALIKKGGLPRGGTRSLTDRSALPSDADNQPTNQPDPASSGEPTAAANDATRTIKPTDPDATRGIRRPDADATRGIKPANPDATRGIKPADPDATRGIRERIAQRMDSTRSIPRVGTEAIRSQAPNPDATRMPGAQRSAQSNQSATLEPGTTLEDRYVIEEIIGVGGMSVVYRGRDLRFKEVTRYCAIKEMYQTSPDSQTRLLSLKNFEREAGLLATLNHHAIPKVYDFFEEHGRAYLVLELIPGDDLETVLEGSTEPLSEEQVGSWALQVCEVLRYLHNHEPEPIIFRDLKPSNMIIAPNNRVVLIDFGIARIFTRSDKKGTMIGTEGYSPPEQYRGIAEARGDIYALGATMHHLLTGVDPRLETPFTFQDRPIRQLNPAVSPEMEAVVMKALEYDMANRWDSADEFKQALLQVPGLAGKAGLSAVPTPSPALGAALRRGQTTELLWSFACEEEVRSSPFVRNDTLFIGCYDTNLYAIDTKRGEFRWKKPTNGGISSSPTVWNDIVIVGSDDGNLYAFDTKNGTQRWVFRTEKPIRSSPRVLDRLIYVGSDDQHVYAIDGMNGRQIWRYRGWNWIRATPCITQNLVVIGAGDGNLYALDAFKGGLRWKQKLPGGIISSAAAADNLVVLGCMDNSVHAVDINGGWTVWKFRTNHYVNSSPAILGNRVFVGSIDGNVYAIDTKNGKSVWSYDTGAQIVSSPAIDSGKIYIGSADGVVHCIDAGAGTAVWTYATKGPVVSSPTVSGGVVYIGSLDHTVYALKA